MRARYAYMYYYVNKSGALPKKLFQINFKYSNRFEIMYA
jgi:hypothetical protein